MSDISISIQFSTNDMYSVLIALIAIANGYAAWLADKTFNAIRRTDVGNRFVCGFILTAISWGLFSLGSQQFFDEVEELRTIFIALGLISKLVGVVGLILGLNRLGEGIREYR